MKPLQLARVLTVGSFALFALAGAPREANASGYLTARFGSDHGTPAQANAFAVYFNPAALGGTKGTTITGDASILLRFARYHRGDDALSPSNQDIGNDPAYRNANTGTANLTNVLALPFLGFNTDFGTRNLRFGYAAYVPFGGLAKWDKRDGVPGNPGTKDGVSRWHNISGQILAIYNTFALAYRFQRQDRDYPAFSIGASASPVIHHVATVRARNVDGSDDTIANGSVIEGRSYIDATGLNFGLSAGIFVEPSEDLRLGLSYISQPGLGETRMSGELKTQLGAGQQSVSKIDFLQTYPDVIRFGVGFKATPRLDLRGDFEFVRWSVFERQCVVEKGASCAVDPDGRRQVGSPDAVKVQVNVPRNWNNAIGFRVGPGYMFTDQLEGFASLGFTTPAVPKETIDAATIDSQRLYATVGARYEISKHFSLAGSYNHIYFVPVDTKGANNQNLSDHPANAPGGGDYNVSRTPSADGKYYAQIGFVNINAAYTF